jgi:hypothetical protein
MNNQEIIQRAKEAGFGCECEEDCAYHIMVGTDEGGQDVVKLPRAAGQEALDRFIESIPESTKTDSTFHYWLVYPAA